MSKQRAYNAKEYARKLYETDDPVMKLVYLNTLIRIIDGIVQTTQILPRDSSSHDQRSTELSE